MKQEDTKQQAPLVTVKKNENLIELPSSGGGSLIDSGTIGTAQRIDPYAELKTPRKFVDWEIESLNVIIQPNGQIVQDAQLMEPSVLVAKMYLDYQDFYSEIPISDRSKVGVRTKQDIQMALDEKIQEVRIYQLELLKQQLAFENTGCEELERLQLALSGQYSKLDLAVLKHFVWQVRRKLFGFQVNNHLMPVLYGPQGSGKSRAIEKLLAPLSSLVLQTTVGEITDERLQPQLAYYYVAFLDEMAGAKKADIEALKRIVTAPTIKVRKLHTHDLIPILQNCTFIGATNKELRSQIKDSTGMRRFFELGTLKRIDWEAINKVDYLKLWKSIDENIEEGFLKDVECELIAHQQGLVAKDEVDEFLDEASLFPGQSKSNGRFISTADLYRKFVTWSEIAGYQYPIPKPKFGQCLVSKGFISDQRKIDGKNTRGFYINPENQLGSIEPEPLY